MIRMLPVIVVFSIFGMAHSQMNPLPEAWKTAILMATEKFGEGTTGVMTIMSGVYATVAPTLIDSTNPMSYLCPGILLWSPQECHKHLLTGKLKCPVCFATGNTTPLSPWRWQLGTTERTQPRKIHNSRGIVLLVFQSVQMLPKPRSSWT